VRLKLKKILYVLSWSGIRVAGGSSKVVSCFSTASQYSNEAHDSTPPRYKVAMLGASGVGKTALTCQFTTSEYICAYDTSLGECSLCSWSLFVASCSHDFVCIVLKVSSELNSGFPNVSQVICCTYEPAKSRLNVVLVHL
jgi:hypothetical protein